VRLADYVALVYHEARNVRYLIRAQSVDSEPWKYVVALPVSRHDAWTALQVVRAEATSATSVAGVLLPFEHRFRVTLSQLAELYANQGWRHASYGGNAWKSITELVRELSMSVEAGRLFDADRSLKALGAARHNTGLLADKLSRLDHVHQHAKSHDGV